LLAILPACDKEEMPEGMDQVSVFVSIQPQVFFAEQIGGKYVDAQPMVTPGQSPATYEPTPAQMSALETAELYFAIGVPFEKSLLPRIEELHPDLRVVNTHEGIERRHLSEHDHGDGEQVTHDDLDPHIWLDPELARKVAQRMGEVLTEAASEQAGAFSENLVNLELRLDSLDARIRRQLQDLEHRTFYVFHPAYGYFADAYGLNQVAVEVGGKEPSAQQIADFIEQARADSIQLILVQPQFSTAAAETIAEEVGAEVVTIDPLAHDYFDTMNKLAETLSRSLGGIGGK
jgi:zinc transport system substrate-binding protein